MREAVDGLVVVAQSCDIVRSCTQRPFMEVAPLIAVDDGVLAEVEKSRRPNLAWVPGVANRRLVADLDRSMTVEKSVVAGWERVEGCLTDQQARDFAAALARKCSRFAFPDDFNRLTRKLQDRLKAKHGKGSAEGKALQALREIRVRAAPSWSAEAVELMFWFVRNTDGLDFAGRGWHEHLASWLALVPKSGRFGEVEGAVTTIDDMTARDYVESDRLDLDYLSDAS